MKPLQAKGVAYVPTEEDRLWLARAVEAEGEPRELVARALVNLFMYRRARGGDDAPRSLTEHVRAYAQPINPAWFPDGGKFVASLAKKSEEDIAAAMQVAERRRDVHARRTRFAPVTIAAVDKALSTPYAGDVTDYAAPYLDARLKGYLARSEARMHENRLWTRAPGWSGYALDGSGGTLTLIAIAGVLLWAATR